MCPCLLPKNQNHHLWWRNACFVSYFTVRIPNFLQAVTSPKTLTMPTSQAGHQRHHTTTGVYMPQTFQPKLASFNRSAILMSQIWAAAYKIVGGDTTLRRPARDQRRPRFLTGWTKLSGLESTPMRKAREKLRVARVERHMPRTRREKDFVSWKCCIVGLVTRVRRREIAKGKIAEMTENAAKVGESN